MGSEEKARMGPAAGWRPRLGAGRLLEAARGHVMLVTVRDPA